MKKAQQSETFTVNIESLSHDGRGIATLQGKTTFINGALPQEMVSCKLIKKHSRYNEGETIDVLKPSPERILPGCPHFGICGGCSLQHIEMQTQIQIKQHTLLDHLKHFGKVVPESILTPIAGHPWGYRRKARLGVRFVRKKQRLLVGFREKNSNYLADIQSCAVLHPSIGTRLVELGELIASLTQFEHIPQIEVAVGDQDTALVFRHLTDLPTTDLEKIIEFAKKNQFHIYLQPNSPSSIHKIWPVNSPDKLSYFLPDYQLEMQFHPIDFIQINGEINQLLLKKAIELLDPQSNEIILDLFCGLGNFTLPLARYAQQVIGIEGTQDMVLRAEENARHNRIQNASFYAANLMEPSKSATWAHQHYDKILLDPPRTGAKEILPFFADFKAKKIVYVSCNPATLARDAGELVYTLGYQLKQVGVVNMFPHTSHIEAIALFEK